MSQKYKTSSGSLEQACIGNPALKQVLQNILSWQSNFIDVSGIDPRKPAGVVDNNSLTPPGVVENFVVIGDAGKFRIAITKPSDTIGVLYYLVQSSETLPFEASTTLTSYGPSPNTTFEVNEPGVTLNWRVAGKFTNSDYGSWFVVKGVSSGSGGSGPPESHHTSHESGGGDEIKLDDLGTPDDNNDLNASTARHGLLLKLNNVSTQFLNGQGAWTTPSTGTPGAHHTTHENGGADEISVTGLAGLLVTPQTPIVHKVSHQSGGSDAIPLDTLGPPTDVTTLNASTIQHGLLKKLDNDSTHFMNGQGNWSVPSGTVPSLHHTTHEDGGSDEINVTGLSGLLVTPQTPIGHKVSHQFSGSDAIKLDDLAAPDDNSDLNATTSAHGLLKKLDNSSVHFLDGQGNWSTPSGFTPASHHVSHEDGGSDEISVTGLSGLLSTAQTPIAHNTTHQSGGSDSIKLDDLAVPDDNTDLNSSTSAHGLLKKLDNNSVHFMDGQGNWNTPTISAIPNPFEISGTGDVIARLLKTDGGTDQKYAELLWEAGGSVLTLRFANDAYTLFSNIMQVVQNGGTYSVNTIEFPAATTVNGNFNILPSGTGNVSSGAYNPTITAISGVTSAGSGAAKWLRVGNIVQVTGKCTIDPSGAGGVISVNIELPVASAFTLATQGYGHVISTKPDVLDIQANTSNGTMNINGSTTDGTSRVFEFTFMYEVI